MTRRKRMRLFGARDKDGNPVEVRKGVTNMIPMNYKGTTMMVQVGEGQRINPRKEYERQMGIRKRKK